MTLADLLGYATQAILVAIAGLTIADFVRHRDRVRLDIALAFSAMAGVIVLQRVVRILGTGGRAWQAVGLLLLLAHPYLMLRLVSYFRPVPRLVHAAAIAGLAGSAALLLATPSPRPAAVSLVLVACFAAVEIYVAVAFVRGARRTAGVTRWRLGLAASASGLLGTALVLSAVTVLAPAARPVASVVSRPIIVLAVVGYYLAFAPPHWLRRIWQLPELDRFLRAHAGRSPAERASAMAEDLCRSARTSVGALAAAVALWDEHDGRLRVEAAAGVPADTAFDASEGMVSRAWRERRPIAARAAREAGSVEAAIADQVGAGAVLAVPIAGTSRSRGALVVFLPTGSLFAADDLALLSLFAEQAAIALDYAALLAEQQALVAELQRGSAQLEALNRELEAFSYSVSHDLRAPLRHISGFAALLEKSAAASLDDQGRRYIRVMAEAAAAMGRLIDDLLAFSRMGRVDLRRTRVRLDALVRDAVGEVQPEANGREIAWTIHPLPEVEGDAAMLRLALVNLLANAVKYTRPRSVAEIEVGAGAGTGEESVLYVRDNGVGFDMTYVDKLFGVFQRLHRADEFEGTGIGLACVRRIVHRHGGRVWAEGALDRGATFYMALPRAAPSAPGGPPA